MTSTVGKITVINPKLVRVDPPELDVDDVFELAEALIDEHGWVKGASGDATNGWSIHGAIGEAARRATGDSQKDGTRSRVFRDEATAALTAQFPQQNEYELNDTATDKDEAIARMRAARSSS